VGTGMLRTWREVARVLVDQEMIWLAGYSSAALPFLSILLYTKIKKTRSCLLNMYESGETEHRSWGLLGVGQSLWSTGILIT
jgi:hypothetical protein